MNEYIFKTQRIGFSIWQECDLDLALSLWSNHEVMKYLSSSGFYNDEQVCSRLKQEISNYNLYGVQYWKIYTLCESQFIGCCGLKPIEGYANSYELGFQLLPNWWGMGYANEASQACIDYAIKKLEADNIYARHHPENEGSHNLLLKLGFKEFDSAFYEPTGLYHPLYKYR